MSGGGVHHEHVGAAGDIAGLARSAFHLGKIEVAPALFAQGIVVVHEILNLFIDHSCFAFLHHGLGHFPGGGVGILIEVALVIQLFDQIHGLCIAGIGEVGIFQAVVLLDDILRHAFAVQAGQIMADNPGILVAHGNGGITGRFDLFAVFQQFGPGGRNFGDTAGFKYSLVVDHLLGGIIPRHAPVGAVLVAGFQHDRVEVILPGGILFQIAGDIQRIAGIHILGDTLTAPGEVDVGGVRAAQQHTGLILDLFVAVGGHLDLNIGVRLFEARHDVIPEYHSLLFREFVDKLDGDLVTGGLCGCCSFRRCLAALSRRCGLRGTSAGASAGSQHAGAEQ